MNVRETAKESPCFSPAIAFCRMYDIQRYIQLARKCSLPGKPSCPGLQRQQCHSGRSASQQGLPFHHLLFEIDSPAVNHERTVPVCMKCPAFLTLRITPSFWLDDASGDRSRCFPYRGTGRGTELHRPQQLAEDIAGRSPRSFCQCSGGRVIFRQPPSGAGQAVTPFWADCPFFSVAIDGEKSPLH